MYEASGDARKHTALAISSTVPRTPAGTSARTWSSFTATPRPLMSGTPGPRIACECGLRPVGMAPGHTQVHRDASRAVGDRHLPCEPDDAVLSRDERRPAAGPV